MGSRGLMGVLSSRSTSSWKPATIGFPPGASPSLQRRSRVVRGRGGARSAWLLPRAPLASTGTGRPLGARRGRQLWGCSAWHSRSCGDTGDNWGPVSRAVLQSAVGGSTAAGRRGSVRWGRGGAHRPSQALGRSLLPSSRHFAFLEGPGDVRGASGDLTREAAACGGAVEGTGPGLGGSPVPSLPVTVQRGLGLDFIPIPRGG